MPLTWDLTRVADLAFVKSEGEWGITETLIFCTMHVGIGEITEKNEDEFYARVHFIEQLNGNLLMATKNGERYDRPIMPLDIHRRIGLRCNVITESRASFVRRHVTNGVIRDAIYKYGAARRNNFEGSEYQFMDAEAEAKEFESGWAESVAVAE